MRAGTKRRVSGSFGAAADWEDESPDASEHISGRGERLFDLCDGTIDITAALFNVSSKEIRRPGRSECGVARVRQIAMYVAHVALRLSMRDVGVGFGRDRTTVLYACHLVEDLRDDREFDQMVQTAERLVTAVLYDREVA